MPNITYTRRDDPVEKVEIISQEKPPNGAIRFRFISPASYEGKVVTLNGNEFHRLYVSPHEVEPTVPERPASFGTQREWREYALWLEREYGHQQPPIKPLKPTTHDAPPLPDAHVDTLGPIHRRGILR